MLFISIYIGQIILIGGAAAPPAPPRWIRPCVFLYHMLYSRRVSREDMKNLSQPWSTCEILKQCRGPALWVPMNYPLSHCLKSSPPLREHQRGAGWADERDQHQAEADRGPGAEPAAPRDHAAAVRGQDEPPHEPHPSHAGGEGQGECQAR